MSEIQQFSQHDIEVLNEETVYKGFFTLKKVQF
ncbi:MAG: ADP-ribose diphosphatase, partial [Haemophilus parainfluenzae]|nr:ADP-ribose diphosphatase [Haemophilus parainfluenzae]